MIIQNLDKFNIILPNDTGYKTKNAITNSLHVENLEIKLYQKLTS